MSDPAPDQQDQPSGKRGEAAWKEARARVAERNQQARKAGIARRQAYEREKERARLTHERRELVALVGKRGKP